MQSRGHDMQVSVPLHMPSPHSAMHLPQSMEQFEQVSMLLHIPSPHRASAGHMPHAS